LLMSRSPSRSTWASKGLKGPDITSSIYELVPPGYRRDHSLGLRVAGRADRATIHTVTQITVSRPLLPSEIALSIAPTVWRPCGGRAEAVWGPVIIQ
jgi:hypothetical protein